MKFKKITGLLASGLPLAGFSHVAVKVSSQPYQNVLTLQDGLTHPLTGIDHFITMLGIGLLSFYIGNNNLKEKTVNNIRSYIKIPLVFCGFLLLAFMTNIGSFLELPKLIPSIIVVTLGFLIFKTNIKANLKSFVWFILPVVAIAHGHIHSTDIYSLSLNFPYIIGFIVTTFILHVVGIKIAERLNCFYRYSHKIIGVLFMITGLCLS